MYIANVLNRNNLRTGRGNFWIQERVTALRSYHKIPVYSEERRAKEGWLNLTQAAHLVGVSARTLRLAVERGEVKAEHPLVVGPWIFNRADLDARTSSAIVARARAHQRGREIPSEQQGNLELSMT